MSEHKNKVEIINQRNNDGRTPLHLAAEKGHLKAVRALLKSGADIMATDGEGQTPLHLASDPPSDEVVERLEVVRALIRSGSGITKNNSGRTPLHLAAEKGHLEVVRDLVMLGLDAFVNERWRQTSKVMSRIQVQSRDRWVQYRSQGVSDKDQEIWDLYKKKFPWPRYYWTDMAQPTRPTQPRLYQMGEWIGYPAAVDMLFKWKNGGLGSVSPNRSISTRNYGYSSEKYIHREDVIEKYDDDSDEEAASYFRHFPELIEKIFSGLHILLFGLGDIEYEDFMKLLQTKVTTNSQNTTIMKLVLDAHKSLSLSEEVDLVELAAGIIAYLRTRPDNINMRDHIEQKTALHRATKSNTNDKIVQVLLQNGADANIQDQNGQTALHVAAAEAKTDIALTLLDGGADIDKQDINGNTPLHIAVAEGKTDFALKLLEKGAGADERDQSGQTALQVAAAKGDTKVALKLLEKDADVDEQDLNGQTPLHVAAATGNTDIAEILLKNRADTNIRDNKRLTPLLLAVEQRQKEMLDKLEYENADPKYKQEALNLTIENEDIDTMHILLDKGTDAKGEIGQRALELAIRKERLGVLRLLLEKDVDVKGDNGTSALTLAVETGWDGSWGKDNWKILAESLVKKGARVNHELMPKIMNRSTSLMGTIIEEGDLHMLEDTHALWWVLNSLNDITDRPSPREQVKCSLIKSLLDRGVNPNIRLGKGQTPFELASRKMIPSDIMDQLRKSSVSNPEEAPDPGNDSRGIEVVGRDLEEDGEGEGEGRIFTQKQLDLP